VFDLIGKRRYAYLASAAILVVSIIFILMTFIPGANLGLQFSIAYTGGTVWEVHFQDGTPDTEGVYAILDEQGLGGSEVAITGSDEREYLLIRTAALALVESEGPAPEPTAGASPVPGSSASAPAGPPLASPAAAPSLAAPVIPSRSEVPAASTSAPASPSPASPVASPDATASAVVGASPAASPAASPEASPEASPVPGAEVFGVPTSGPLGALATALQERYGPIDEVRQQDSVGAVVSNELIQQTFMLIAMASLGILLWITFRFRDFRMGATAVGALLHDVVVTVGLFALISTFFHLQVDALFVTAMLTVIGFSVHDTIVVFDRIRENRERFVGEPLEAVVNHSLMQTLGRSLTTSLTLILTLLALLFFGGEAIRSFVLVLLIGVTAGTYSSIFVATPLFLDWHLWEDRRKARQAARPVPA
jgi:preprotein translocase SecF subunit